MADKAFDYFVVFAEMRTGSNFLEENLNAFKGVKCWGEVFNPQFVGKSNKTELHGVTLEEREKDPLKLLDLLREKTDGLAGFRFFNDHDPRVLDHVLDDPRCAKLILTRNPLESYVSRRIAAQTGQWRLGDFKDARTARITFVKEDFERMLERLKAFQLLLMRRLQTSGQTAFYINYEDIQDVEVMNGIARYFGVDPSLEATVQKTKVQNPSALRDKVENYEEMVQALSDVDHFALSNTPNFEPRRGPAVPSFVAAPETPLLYLPVRGGAVDVVETWLSQLDGGGEPMRGFTQKLMRQWLRRNKDHRVFTVVSHPVARLHRTFCQHILAQGDESFGAIRAQLRSTYKLPLPDDSPGADYSREQHRAAFLGFARFIKGNLNGQTSVRVDGAWASQSEVIRGFGQVLLPDMILREDDLSGELAHLARMTGHKGKPPKVDSLADAPFALSDIYDQEIEDAVKDAYKRDYLYFGFKPWSKAALTRP